MDCKEFEKLIPGFIEQRLDYPTLKKFSGHMEQCENCKEELVIRFLVTEGVQRLEEGSAFDLQRELDRRLSEMQCRLRKHGRMLRIGIAMELVAACLLIWIVVWILL